MTTRTDDTFLAALTRLSVPDLVDFIALVGCRLWARQNGTVDVGWLTDRYDHPPPFVPAVAWRNYLIWDEVCRRGGTVEPGEGRVQ